MNMHDEIAKMAYLLYEKKGKVDGGDLDDWLEAEKIILGIQNGQMSKGSDIEIHANKKGAKRKGYKEISKS